MQKNSIASLLGAVCILCAAIGCAGTTEKALWIESREHGQQQSVVAITEPVARAFLASDEKNVHFSKEDGKDVITKEMVRDLLDGRKQYIDIGDDEEGTTARLFVSDLHLPSSHGGNNLVMDIYKEGKMTFHLSLGEAGADKTEQNDANISIDWKELLPFLTREGCGVYIRNQEEETEIWVYVD